jgi:hypothetical protein
MNFDGRHVICLRDPSRLTDDAVLVPRETLLMHRDRRRIGGFPPTSILLRTTPTTAGAVLKYDQAVEPATQSMVSYASMGFH